MANARISILTAHPDAEVGRLQAVLGEHLEVEGRWKLEHVLGALIRARADAKTLDLIGHATSDGLLQLGDWIIDGASPTVTAFFRNIADLEVLPRLGIQSVRLLGCNTAVTDRARATLATLAELLELDVRGTLAPIYCAHFGAEGFHDEHAGLLSSAGEPPRSIALEAPAPGAASRSLDIDALPLVSLASHRPRHLVDDSIARELLSLVDRTRGAQWPGLLAIPSHELALTSSRGACRIAQVILDGQFVRVYPAGDREPGILYPIFDPPQLIALANELPIVTP